MTTFKKLSIVFALTLALLAVAQPAAAQSATTVTTLNGAMTRGVTTACLTSSTSVLAAGFNNQPLTGLYIDREYMTVANNVNASGTGNCWVVKRGAPSTGEQTPHASGALVWVGPPGIFDLGPNDRAGSCTAAGFTSFPIIEVRTGRLARCVGSQWLVGEPITNASQPYTAFATLSPANPIATTSVTDVAGTIWFSQIRIPSSAVLTGACVLNGATVGTDKWIVALYDAGGVLVANSATAGTTTATASKYQCIAFTATVPVVGPGTYYVALQGNGTTDNFQTYATASAPTNYGTQSQTGTFGTLAAMTTPTVTFTAAKGPLMLVY